MASYELSAFDRFHAVSVVGAIEQQAPHTLNVGFGFVIQINSLSGPRSRGSSASGFLWEETCFEIFVGVHDEDYYREINLSLLKHGSLISLKNIAIQKVCLPCCLRYRTEPSQAYSLWLKC